jgi:DNA-binding MarR family transcriptional regulator
MPIRSPGPEARYDLENSIGYLLNRAAHLIAARFGDELKLHGVNLQTWRILAALSQSGTQSMSGIADHTGAELSYLLRSVVALEQHGLVERAPSPADRRTTLVSLTEVGQDLVRELAPKGRAMEALSVTGVPPADLQATLRTLRAVCHNLVGDDQAPAAVNRKLTVARRVRNRAQTQALVQSEPASLPAAKAAGRRIKTS